MNTESKHYSPENLDTSRSKAKNPLQHSRKTSETDILTEISLKLFLSLLVSLIGAISLARLLPYHFAQSAKLKELRAQVKETEHRVKIKRQQLHKNFDSWQIETLMEEHSPRISQGKVRVLWQKKQQKTSQNGVAH